MTDDNGFSGDLKDLGAFRLFARAMPIWTRRYPGGGTFLVRGKPGEVEIDFAMAKLGSDEEMETAYTELMDILKKEDRLMTLQVLVDELRGAGVSSEVLDPMIIEAEQLARELHPEEPFNVGFSPG